VCIADKNIVRGAVVEPWRWHSGPMADKSIAKQLADATRKNAFYRAREALPVSESIPSRIEQQWL